MTRRPGRAASLYTIVLGALAASGCGGGHDGDQKPPPPPPPSPQSQSITFADPGPLYRFVGDASYANAASGGAGSGAITYASDTPAVATVDQQTGQVTIAAAGVAQITATKTADASYLAAQAQYSVRIAPRTVAMSAWIGGSDSAITFEQLPLQLDFTRSSDLNCSPSAYQSCSDGTRTQLSTTTLVDTVATLSRPSIYWLNHGSHATEGIVLPEQKFGFQMAPGVAVLNGRLWLVDDEVVPPAHSVWSSSDGVNWRLETADAGIPPRSRFKLVAFNNALWLIGGSYLQNLSDVWKSTDGKAWTQVTAAGFPPRQGFAAAAFNGRLWISGGANGSIELNDVWSSADGIAWTQATAAATTEGREQHQLVSFNGKLFLIGGWNTGVALADIWSSTDGITWSEATASAAFGGRFAEQVVSDGSTLWLTAGYDVYQSPKRDVWSSTDGTNWVEVTDTAEFTPRADHGSAWFQGSTWVIGGASSEVWSSTTGVHWSKQSLSARIPGPSAVTTTSYQGRLWALGEESQLWSSADGISWTEEPSVPGGVTRPFLLGLPDRLLLVAGWQYAAPDYYRGVWQSIDGRNWTQLETAAPFPATGLIQVLQFNGQIWAFSGTGTYDETPEIWSSPDAINWTRVAANPPYGPRGGYKVLAYNNRLWVLAGSVAGLATLNDIWSSADGVNWSPVTQVESLPPGNFGQAIALDSGMCLYSSQASNGLSAYDAWCSSDGSTWTQKSTDTPRGPLTILNGSVFMIGNSATTIGSTDLVWKSGDGVSWRLGYHNTMRFP